MANLAISVGTGPATRMLTVKAIDPDMVVGLVGLESLVVIGTLGILLDEGLAIVQDPLMADGMAEMGFRPDALVMDTIVLELFQDGQN